MCRVMTLIAILSASCFAHAQEPVTANLNLAIGNDCYISEEGAGLWSALIPGPEAGAILLQAEEATVLELLPGKEVLEDERCGGGQCIAHVKHAEFVFTVAPGQGGRYQAWAHTYLPRPGSWNHSESMDGGNPRTINDSARWTFGQWIWTELGDYKLGAGEHTFKLHGWLGGAQLDAIIFGKADTAAFADRPKLFGAPGIADTGTITTSSALPSGVTSWGQLTVDADANGGTVAAEVSTDGGQSWQAVGADGDLTAVPIAGDGTDSLLARLTIAAAADGASPLVRSVTVSWMPDESAEQVLENDLYRITLARHTGALAGIYNKAAGSWATAPHVQRHMLGLALREPGATEQTVVAPEDMQFEGASAQGGRLTARYSAAEGRVEVVVDMSADATALADWQIAVTNNSDLEVIRVDFPLIGGVAIDDFRDDECIVPRTGGYRLKTAEMEKPWMTTYLGGGSMNWLDVCDPSAGLFVMGMDQRLTTTELEAAPAAGRQAADLAMRTHTMVAPGQTKTRQYRVGVHEGDWHWGADRYREWAYSWMKHPDDPEWVKWIDGWSGAMSTPFEHMDDLLRSSMAEGFSYLQYWGQMTDGIDQCCGNFYWPAPALGGADAFKRGVDQVHAMGGKVTGYMNCQTWTRDACESEFLRLTPRADLPDEALSLLHGLDWFETARLFPLNGKPIPYNVWHIMCPASDAFREHLRFWIVDMYAKRFGADGVYVDQTGAAMAKPCYNLSHGHDDIGDWGMGNTEMLRVAVEQGRAINPDFAMSIEGSGDALGQYASLHLISGLCMHPEVYHYTFPDHILISGLSNNSKLTGSQRITRAFINGDRFDTRLGNTEFFIATQLRQRIKRWLYPARFMDTVGLEVSDEAVLARWNICDQPGERAIVMVFENEQLLDDVTCTLALPEGWQQPPTVCFFDREGNVRTEAPSVADGKLSVVVPASLISAALVLYETAPANVVDVWQTDTGAPLLDGQIALNAANIGAQDLQATLRVDVAAPLTLAEPEISLNLPAGATEAVELALAGFELLELPAPVRLTASWPGGSRTTSGIVRPLLLNPSLQIDEDGDQVPDYWRRSGTKSTFATGFDDVGAWIQGDPEEYQFFIQLVPLQTNTE